MTRTLAGVLLVLHGLAHTLAGMRATDVMGGAASGGLLWAATALWLLAALGFIAAGAGRLGAAPFRTAWREAAWIGVGASVVLLAAFWRVPLALPALAANAAVAAALLRTRGALPHPHGPARRASSAAAVLLVAWLGLLILARPWHMRWGSTGEELHRALPGDEAAARPSYQIQHAVAIGAPPEEVWPWLAQLGHDRGGFYSYAWLENAFGLRVRNADRVHPEWQSIAAGDTVLATPDDYLGLGRRYGWRVARAEPGRVLVLENWGAFVLEPAGDGTTKLIVRTRGGGSDGLASVALAPLGLFLFEPAHFVMQRRMLVGIRARTEAAHQPSTGGP
jgi:hypothetical protein